MLLCFVINQFNTTYSKHIINTIKKDHNNKQKVNELIAYVNTHGGIGYAKAAMEKLIQEALEILDTFEDNDAKSSLRELVKYIVQRSH